MQLIVSLFYVIHCNFRTAAVLRAEIWPKKKRGDNQQERIKAFESYSKEGVYRPIFEGKSTDNLRSMITNLMKLYRQHNNNVVMRGTGISPEPLEGDMAVLVSNLHVLLACTCCAGYFLRSSDAVDLRLGYPRRGVGTERHGFFIRPRKELKPRVEVYL